MTVKVQRRVMAMQVKMFAEILLKLKKQVQHRERARIVLLFDLETKKEKRKTTITISIPINITQYIVMLIFYSLCLSTMSCSYKKNVLPSDLYDKCFFVLYPVLYIYQCMRIRYFLHTILCQ